MFSLINKLNFKSHIEHLSKLSRSIGIPSKLRFLFNSSTLLLLYYSFVHFHLLFSIDLWGSTSQSLLSKLQKLQNQAIRIITNTKTKSHITPQLYKLRILKIQDLYTYEIAKLMHQHSHQITPACFFTLFINLSTIHARQTGSITNKNLYLPKYSNPVVKNLLNFKDQKFGIPYLLILKKMTFSNFKKKYKQKLLENYL